MIEPKETENVFCGQMCPLFQDKKKKGDEKMKTNIQMNVRKPTFVMVQYKVTSVPTTWDTLICVKVQLTTCVFSTDLAADLSTTDVWNILRRRFDALIFC